MIVKLAPEWMKKATDIGIARDDFAKANNCRDYGEVFNGSTREHHIAGAIGECSTAKHFKLFWKAHIGVFDQPDVGGVLDVRTRRISKSGRDLVIRPDDTDDRPYVGCWLYDDNSVEIYGWLYAREAKGKGVWFANMGIWFVPPPYRDLSELEAILKVAA